jgi:hypothetical protein
MEEKLPEMFTGVYQPNMGDLPAECISQDIESAEGFENLEKFGVLGIGKGTAR